jgi:putative ABC transport system substrate-binding protein
MRLARIATASIAGAALLAAPLIALAQPPPGKIHRIGWLHPLPIPPDWEDSFRQALREFGYVEGKNVHIEHRLGGGIERLPAMAAELVQLNVDVLIAGNSAAVQALKNATGTIPIVMVRTNNPVALGLVTSLARPGGNITGLSGLGDLGPKRLDLLKEVMPGLSRVAMLSNLGNPSIVRVVQETQAAARTLGIELHSVDVRDTAKIDQALAAALQTRPDGLVLPAETVVHDPHVRARIAEFALKHRLPSIGAWREFAQAGGLMAYGISIPDVFRRAVGYVDKILRGARAGDLPVQEPSKIEFVVNLRTAKALGLSIPPPVLARADEMIQ